MTITNDPFVVEDPIITINGVSYKCASREASLLPEDMKANVSTWCNPKGEKPSSTGWTFDTVLLLSYGAIGTGVWNTLHALRKSSVVCTLAPDDGAEAVTNPIATFSIYVPTLPFMKAKIGDAQPFNFTAVVIGEPAFDVTP